jgi:hypothetical protein
VIRLFKAPISHSTSDDVQPVGSDGGRNIADPASLWQAADCGVPPALLQHSLPAHSFVAVQPGCLPVPSASRISENAMRDLSEYGTQFIRDLMTTTVRHS